MSSKSDHIRVSPVAMERARRLAPYFGRSIDAKGAAREMTASEVLRMAMLAGLDALEGAARS